jgi:hypothetical protein
MAIGEVPDVINQTRGALCGGKCGDLGRGGREDDGALLCCGVMLQDSGPHGGLSHASLDI